MKKSKTISLLIILTISLLISGCSVGSFNLFGNSKNKAPQEDLSGLGLEVIFDIDKIFTGKNLNYRLEIKNTGREEIKLTKEDIKLTTLQMDETGTKKVFTQKSIDLLYNNLFKDGDILLPQNVKLQGISGQLEVADWIFKTENIKNFEYTFKIKYHTKTIFSNNLEIQKLEKEPLTVTDKLSQAAPVQITHISAESFKNNIYHINYQLEDKAKTQNTQFLVNLQNMEFKFGSKDLTECMGFLTEGNALKRLPSLTLKNSQPTINYICKVDLSDYANTKTTTKTSGSFDYDYAYIQTESISLPENREIQDIFE